jgi:hypothetical protein
VLAHVDVDVAHAGVGHGAAGPVVGDQPAHHLALAAAGIEVDRLARCVLGYAPGSGNERARPAGRDELHGAELHLDAIEQRSRGQLQAAAAVVPGLALRRGFDGIGGNGAM